MMMARPGVRRLRHFFRLSNRERRILFGALLVLTLTVAGLKLFGYKRWLAVLQRWAVRTQWAPLVDDEIATLARTWFLFTRAVGMAPVPGKCLSQSLTLWWLLMRQGIASDLRIGVRNQDGKFEAHAWIEYAGRPVNDAPDVRSRFAVFDTVAGLDNMTFVGTVGGNNL